MSRVSKSSPVSFHSPLLRSWLLNLSAQTSNWSSGSHLETWQSQILSDLTRTHGYVSHLDDKSRNKKLSYPRIACERPDLTHSIEFMIRILQTSRGIHTSRRTILKSEVTSGERPFQDSWQWKLNIVLSSIPQFEKELLDVITIFQISESQLTECLTMEDVCALETPVLNLEKCHSDRDASRTFMQI